MSNNSLILFEGQEVTILLPEDVNFQFKGDFLILAKNVANSLEYARTEEISKFCKKEHVFLVKNNQISSSAIHRIRKLNNTGETFISNLSLNRVLGKSEKPKAEKFQDWLYEDMLPTIQMTGQYTLPGTESDLLHFKKAAYMVEVAANVLRLPDTGRLKLLGDFNRQYGLTVPLPGYADEPLTESATELLKKHSIGMQTKVFNALLLNGGILEERERPSSKGRIKTFKSLTDSGLEYGKNIISPANPRETAPHYYPERFPDLLRRVGLLS
ncbi:prophage antirepressor-like protein [Paenibacillus sp. LBL]|uniref:BRO-N domain-containing protein n=1 Tax=Paenibacillus sp. LBL TaxID=2940563 RepID=UPI002475BA46|nr:BRO family protein [Paenibacillus sp. LBL]MDH6673191.1 prophage antirepressor-like protein [Paenibacillus sp. LBL]